MTKDEAEKGIRYLCHVWGKAVGVVHSTHLNLRNRVPMADVPQQWFEQHLKETLQFDHNSIGLINGHKRSCLHTYDRAVE